jgi:hypothetical protein
MAHNLGLLAHRLVRLVILIGLGSEGFGVNTTCNRFLIKIMGLLFAALIDEVGREIKLAFYLREIVQLHQRDFDFLMSAITVVLVRTWSECLCQMIHVFSMRPRSLRFPVAWK